MYQFKKILFGIDLNHIDGDAMDYAIHLAERNKATLTILYTCPTLALPSLQSLIPSHIGEGVKSEAEQQLTQYCKQKIKVPIDWNSLVVQSNSPYQELIALAQKQKMDLIVLGVHDRHGIDAILIGSNTEKVVRHAPCSVIVIKKKKEDSA